MGVNSLMLLGEASVENARVPHWSLAFDILFVVILLVGMFFFYKSKKALRVYIVFLGFLTIYAAVSIINVYTTRLLMTKTILNWVLLFILLVFVTVYQQDFKTMFSRISRSFDRRKVIGIKSTEEELMHASSEIVKAFQTFSKNCIGALVVITPDTFDDRIIESGTILNSKISGALLESIFSTKGPLHDGALLIKGDTILAAGCLLPNSESSAISPELGTRHRAAIGVTENTNCLAVVASEENGVVSIAVGGRLKRYMTPEQLNENILDVIKGDYREVREG